jgi:hypothetical protein
MGVKITKVEFDALPDSLKVKFKPEGEDFAMEEPDVTGLKKNKDELLKELKELKEKYGDLDPEAAKKALEAASAADEERLKAEGQWKTLEEKLKERHLKEITDATGKYEQVIGNLKTEKLKSFLVEKGVLPDRAAYALADISDQIDLVSGEQGFTLKLKNGIGDAQELDGAVDSLKAKANFLFAAPGASGSGASGSGNDNGGGNAGKTMPKAQWDTLDVRSQAAFIKEGGKPVG